MSLPNTLTSLLRSKVFFLSFFKFIVVVFFFKKNLKKSLKKTLTETQASARRRKLWTQLIDSSDPSPHKLAELSTCLKSDTAL